MLRVNPGDELLVDLVYTSLLGETSWQQFLDSLSGTLPGGKASLFFYDPSRNAGAFSLSSGMSDKNISDFDNHFCRINPWMKRATVRPVGLGTVAEQMCPRDEFVHTEFYNDFIKAMELETAVGITIMRDAGCCFFLTNITKRVDADENRHEAERLSRLAPHLHRAFRYYRKRGTHDAVAAIGESLLDAIDVGVIIVGERMAIKTVSKTAEEMMDRQIGVEVSPVGKIRFSSLAATEKLASMLDRLRDGPKLTYSLVGSSKLTFVRIRKDNISEFFEGPTVAILIEPILAAGRRIDFRDFADNYGLTAAETRALNGLLSGQTAGEIAEQFVLSRETIRSQIKSLYAKLGVGSQVELVRMTATLSRGLKGTPQ